MRAHENPFATDKLEQRLFYRPEWSGTSWEELEWSWAQRKYRGALIGRHGAGKSTLLAAWKELLEGQGKEVISLFLNREERRITDWDALQDCAGKYVFLDGEEQLTWFTRRSFLSLTRPAAGVIITRHRRGTLEPILHLSPDLSVMKNCLREIDPTILPEVQELLPEWWKQERGNMRHILLRCYDFKAQGHELGSPSLKLGEENHH